MTIRPIRSLTDDEIRLLARDQADAGEPCVHGFERCSAQASLWETAYCERAAELSPLEE